MTLDAFLSIITIFLSSLFFVSSIPKIFNMRHFINLVIQYEVVPKPVAILYAILLPITEVCAAILILKEDKLVVGLLALLVILFTFKWAVSTNIKRKKDIACGCHGKFLDSKVDKFTLVKIYILLLSVCTLLAFNFLKPISLTFSVEGSLLGFYLTLLILMAQKVWSIHKSTIDTMQDIENEV
jgi:Methylamine utilisation protein MauE